MNIKYYQRRVRHHKWAVDAKGSHDWRLKLQLFLDEPSSSRGAFAFSVAVFGAIVFQARLPASTSRLFLHFIVLYPRTSASLCVCSARLAGVPHPLPDRLLQL